MRPIRIKTGMAAVVAAGLIFSGASAAFATDDPTATPDAAVTETAAPEVTPAPAPESAPAPAAEAAPAAAPAVEEAPAVESAAPAAPAPAVEQTPSEPAAPTSAPEQPAADDSASQAENTAASETAAPVERTETEAQPAQGDTPATDCTALPVATPDVSVPGQVSISYTEPCLGAGVLDYAIAPADVNPAIEDGFITANPAVFDLPAGEYLESAFSVWALMEVDRGWGELVDVSGFTVPAEQSDPGGYLYIQPAPVEECGPGGYVEIIFQSNGPGSFYANLVLNGTSLTYDQVPTSIMPGVAYTLTYDRVHEGQLYPRTLSFGPFTCTLVDDGNENVTPPTLSVDDGPYVDDATYDTSVLDGRDEFTFVVNDDGSVTLTATDGHEFDDQQTYTYPVPTDGSPVYVLALWRVVDADGNGDIWDQEFLSSLATDSTDLTQIAWPTACGTYQVDLYDNTAGVAGLLAGGVLTQGDAREDFADISGPVWDVHTVSDCTVTLPADEVPSAVDSCGVNGDQLNVPADGEHYSYEVDDQRVDGVGEVIVTRVADAGYTLPEGENTWTFVFTDEPCVVAQPPAPQFVDGCGVESDGVSWIDTPEYTYAEVASSIQEDGTRMVTVEVTANDGYVFADGTVTSWDFTFTNEPCPPEVATPVNPLEGVPNCSDFTVPSTPGVYYVVTATDNGPWRTITVTATPLAGYVFAGESQVVVYTATYDMTCGGLPPTTVTPVKPTAQLPVNTGWTPVTVTQPAPTITQPTSLPRTGGQDVSWLLGFGALLALGGATLLRRRTATSAAE